MKKLMMCLLFLLFSINIGFANEFIIDNGVKYISEDKAEDLFNVLITHYPNSKIVQVKSNDDIYVMKVGEDRVKKNFYINPFFANSEKLAFNGGNKLRASVKKVENMIYLPISFFYDTFYDELEYDVIVVGGDPEGVTAAVSAARNGAKTLLLSGEDGLGGLFTYGMLNTIDMNYSYDGELLTKGIFDEFYDKVGRTESFSVEKVKKIFEDMVLYETNIDYRTNISFSDVILEDNVIKGIIINHGDEAETFYGKRVIDATQNGDVCAKAGVPFYSGMEDINIDENMAATLVFKVGGVSWRELYNDINRYMAETGDKSCGINESSAWGFGKWCYGNYNSIYYNMKFRGPNMGLQDDGTVLINALQIFYVDPIDKESVALAKKHGEIEAKNAFNHLKSKLKSFENAYFIGVANELYIREARHIQGEYVLQASDLLEGVNFPDKIAMGSYPLDIQSTSMENNGYVVLCPDQYSIPYRCIVPKVIDNLFIVGKSASYSSVAAGSARVVPVGMVEGESAGLIAMYTIKNNVTPREIIGSFEMMEEVTELLIKQGVYLPDYEPLNPFNDIRGYEKIAKLIDYGVITGGYNNDFKFNEMATGISTANVIRNLWVRHLGADEENIKSKLSEFSTSERIPLITLIRMVYALNNDDYNEISDSNLWDWAYDTGVLEDMPEKINMWNAITMRDMYIVVVNGVENIVNY